MNNSNNKHKKNRKIIEYLYQKVKKIGRIRSAFIQSAVFVFVECIPMRLCGQDMLKIVTHQLAP
jgi:hypothetical protein